uniref:Uroplakin-1b n=1 Tax=Podarcis muralis TaxID=64176 RepID=A0A670IEE6_PODMU
MRHVLGGCTGLHSRLKMAKGDTGARCFQGLLIMGNVVMGCCGLALMAECIFFVSDQQTLYPLLEATDNDDIYGAAWIGIFTGFAFFCMAVLGIVGVVKSNRTMLLVLTPNLFLKQMLEKYQNPDPINNDDKWKSEGITRTWDRLMLQNKCCGVVGPSDWQAYNSVFRKRNQDADFPWPRQCCVMDLLGKSINVDACKLGMDGYYHKDGCYPIISGPMDRHAWGVAWFGFAILCWTTWVLLCTMFYWSRIEY